MKMQGIACRLALLFQRDSDRTELHLRQLEHAPDQRRRRGC